MNKEEVINKHFGHLNAVLMMAVANSASNAMDEWAGHLISNSSHTTATLQVPKRILDEYAKQQSIAYDEWKWANRWHSLENGFWYQTLEHPCAMSDKTYNKHHRKTPQELYNQFIEQQNKLT